MPDRSILTRTATVAAIFALITFTICIADALIGRTG